MFAHVGQNHFVTQVERECFDRGRKTFRTPDHLVARIAGPGSAYQRKDGEKRGKPHENHVLRGGDVDRVSANLDRFPARQFDLARIRRLEHRPFDVMRVGNVRGDVVDVFCFRGCMFLRECRFGGHWDRCGSHGRWSNGSGILGSERRATGSDRNTHAGEQRDVEQRTK